MSMTVKRGSRWLSALAVIAVLGFGADVAGAAELVRKAHEDCQGTCQTSQARCDSCCDDLFGPGSGGGLCTLDGSCLCYGM